MGEKDRLGAVHSQSGQDCRALLSDYATAGFTAAIVQIAACHPFVDAIATPVLIIEVRILNVAWANSFFALAREVQEQLKDVDEV